MSVQPAIILVHGSYHPPAVYDGLTSRLRDAGFDVVLPRLASLGPDVFGITTEDDVSVVRQAAESFFAAGRDIVLVGHSYGGFVAMVTAARTAIVDVKDGRSEGRGNFKGVVYISATLPTKREGTAIDVCNPGATTEPDLPEIYDIRTVAGKLNASIKNTDTSKRYFFEPGPKKEIDKTMALLECQCPDVFYQCAQVLPSDLSIPQTYIISEKDGMVPLELQEQIAASGGMKIERFADCGHAPFLNHPQKVAEIIIKAASV